MGNPPRNPWAPSSVERNPFAPPPKPIVTEERPRKEAPEKKEAPKGQRAATIEDYEKKKDKFKVAPDAPTVEQINEVKGNIERAKQFTAYQAFEAALTSVLRKLDDAGYDIMHIGDPGALEEMVNAAKEGKKFKLKKGVEEPKIVELNKPEEVAVQRLNQVISEKGPTATIVKTSWKERKETAIEANKGLGSKYLDYWKEDPVQAGFYTILGASILVGAGFLIKTGVQKAFASKEVDTSKGEKGASWAQKKIWIPIGLGLAGLVLGPVKLKSILASCGIDYFELEEKVKKGEEFTEDQKQKLQESGKKVQKQIEEERKKEAKAKGAGGAAAEAAEAPEAEEPESVPGALQTTEEAEESQKLLESGIGVLDGSGAYPLNDGTYLVITDGVETYFRFENGKWEWASKKQKEEGKWVATGANYYDDKEKFRRVNEISAKLAAGPEKPEQKPEEAIDENVKEALKYSVSRDMLIETYIYLAGGDREYSPVDIGQIERSIDQISGKKISEIQAFWEKNKNNKSGTIPRQNSLGNFGDDTREENIYLAVKIVATTATEFQKYSPKEDVSSLTPEQFFEKHINNDDSRKVSLSIQRSFIKAIEDGDITDLTELNDVNLEALNEQLKAMGADARDELATEFGIDLNEINKKDFGIMLGFLEQYGDLVEEDPDTAFARIKGFPKSSDEKTNEAVRIFYREVRKKTIETIIPAAVTRYNLDETVVSNKKKNPDIIKKHLNKQIKFNRAFFLCMVTRSMDLSKPAGSPQQELAFLFTVLGSIPREEKAKYISELAAASIDKLDKLPSLAALQPYISMVGKFAITRVEKRLRTWGYWLSAFMRHRSPEEQEEFLSELRDKPFFDFGWLREGAKEFGGGGLQIGWDFLRPFIESGKVTLDEISHCEGPIDFMQLAVKAGATFMFGEDENGEPTGMMHFMGDVFWCRPWGIVWETLKSAKDGDLGGMIQVWTVGSAPFVAYGAAHGFLRAYWNQGGWQTGRQALGALKGGGKMAVGYPYYALRATYRVGKQAVSSIITAPIAAKEYGWRRPVDVAKRAGRGMADLVRYRSIWPGQNIPNMLDNARWFEHYSEGSSELSGLSLKQKLHYLKSAEGRGVLISRLGKSFNTSMALRRAVRFARDYNHFFNFEPASLFRLKVSEIEKMDSAEIGKLKEDRIPRLRAFLEGTNSYGPTFDKMRALIREGKYGTDLEGALAKLMKAEMHSLEEAEARALAKQLLSEKDINNLQARMKKGLEAIRKEATITAVAIRRKESAPSKPKLPKLAAKITIPVDLGGGKYRYMGEEIQLRTSDIDQMTKKMEGDRAKATERLCRERWSQPRMVHEGPKGRTYRYRGGEFVLTPAEYQKADAKGIARLCEAKYAESINIQDARMVKGVPEVKINGQWVKAPEGPGALDKIKKDYIEAAKRAGYELTYRDLSNYKVLKYWPVLEKIAGPAMAVAMIHHLETAENKREAVAETGVAIAAIYAGMAGARKATSFWTPASIKGQIGKQGLIFLAGIGTAIGVTEPISDLLDDMIPKFAGDQQMAVEMISFFEKATARSITTQALHRLEVTVAKKAIEKKGLQSIGKFLGKKIESTVLKKIATFASKPLLRKVALSLGVRGTVLAGLLVDDATVIGVIDDVVAVGMGVWMAKDVYDLAVLTSRSYKIKEAMEAYNKLPIAEVQPATVTDEKAIEAALATHDAKIEDLSGEELMELIKTIPDIRLKITREGSSGYEEYRFVKGEVYSTKIKTQSGEILELSDEELNQEIAVGPPQEFRTWEIDYNQPKEKLEANYRMALLYTKSECGWTKLDFEIKDGENILLKRLDSPYSTTITRSGDKWAVEGFSSGHTLFQALVLANLVNKIHGIFAKESHYGGSDQPFHMDGGNIDFDKSWNPVDLRILSEETSWLSFYDKVGVNKQAVVDTLNAWYRLEYKPLADAA
ncbi:hypothetical protein JXD20_02095 [Candidatus Peregrinibacteria bacterium]|nr:hypothetical protein [Candidatus Peregrinibacteria bacterium]